MFTQRALARCAGQRATIIPRAATRGYAAAAADTKPPVALYGLDGTYANALVSRNKHWMNGLRCTRPDGSGSEAGERHRKEPRNGKTLENSN